MGHEVAELTAGLASRINNLAIMESGPDSRKLLEQQDRLAKLAMLVIVNDLHAERQDYQACIKCLKEAIAYIGDADKKITNISKAIRLAAKAADSIEKVVQAASKYV